MDVIPGASVRPRLNPLGKMQKCMKRIKRIPLSNQMCWPQVQWGSHWWRVEAATLLQWETRCRVLWAYLHAQPDDRVWYQVNLAWKWHNNTIWRPARGPQVATVPAHQCLHCIQAIELVPADESPHFGYSLTFTIIVSKPSRFNVQ